MYELLNKLMLCWNSIVFKCGNLIQILSHPQWGFQRKTKPMILNTSSVQYIIY